MTRMAGLMLGFLLFSWSLVEMTDLAALAAEPQKQPETELPTQAGTDDNWEFGVVPYIWFMSINGDVTAKGNEASIDSSFGDIWDSLNFGLMGLLQVRKGRIGGYADILYARLQTENGVLSPGCFPARVQRCDTERYRGSLCGLQIVEHTRFAQYKD